MIRDGRLGWMLSRTFSILATNAREAFESLRRARLRTVLGLVGIMIGISSVIATISLGEIVREQARRQFEALGTDLLVIRKHYETEFARIDLQDALQLASASPSIVVAAPRISGNGTFRFGGKQVGQGAIQGVTRSFADVNKLWLEEGRFISDMDTDRYWCVIGAEVAQKMREAGAQRLLGAVIELNKILFTVAGVLHHREESYALPVRVNADQSVFIPITTSQRVVFGAEIESITARSGTGVHYQRAADEVRSFFHKRAPDLGLEIVTAKELIARMEEQMGLFTLLLGLVGSISLIVGGIGIMNIMLVSVAERRAEIAIRRALGARRQDIQSQFLIESVILTVIGGVLGIVLGLVATWTICRFTGWEFLLSGLAVTSSLGTAVVVGLFFGFQPAHQASRLDPIAGLQGN